MRRTIVTTLCAAVLVLSSGCDNTHESLMDDMLDEMENMIAVLKTIKDEASAKSAESKLRSIVDKLNSLQERVKKVKQPEGEEAKALEKKFEERAKKIMGEFLSEMMRVSSISPEVATILSEAKTGD
jgi:hypothetical protein